MPIPYARILPLTVQLAVASALIACSSGSESTFTLQSATPADGATGVSRNVAAQLVFSKALDPAAAAGAVTLAHAGGAAALGLAVSGAQLTATPSQRLLPLTSYTLNVGTAVRAADGAQLGNAYAIRFTTADRTWGTAQLIETDNAGDATVPKVAVDENGNAIAVWVQSDGTRDNIWANRYTPAGGWGVAQLLETDNAGNAAAPTVVLDGSGNALAAWHQFDGVRWNVWTNRYTAGAGWGAPQLLENDDVSHAGNPQLAADAANNIMAVWVQHDGTRYNAWARRYTPGSGWGAPQLIEALDGTAWQPKVTMDPAGNAVAIWRQEVGANSTVQAARYTPAGGWGAAQQIDSVPTTFANYLHVTADASGNAIAVWHQTDGAWNKVYANRFTPSGGWGVAQRVDSYDGGDASWPQVAVDANGNAFLAWQQTVGVRDDIWISRFAPASGWGAPQLFETDDRGDAYDIEVGFDAAGNALLVWAHNDGIRYNVTASRYTPAGGWSGSQLIETDDIGNANSLSLAIARHGGAFAVWRQQDGTRYNVWSNRFD